MNVGTAKVTKMSSAKAEISLDSRNGMDVSRSPSNIKQFRPDGLRIVIACLFVKDSALDHPGTQQHLCIAVIGKDTAALTQKLVCSVIFSGVVKDHRFH